MITWRDVLVFLLGGMLSVWLLLTLDVVVNR